MKINKRKIRQYFRWLSFAVPVIRFVFTIWSQFRD